MAKKYKQGYYTPKHPEKYIGDIDNIVYRSGWELKLNIFLDSNTSILRWGSEPFPIWYIKPTTKRKHRYFVDYFVEYKTKDGEFRRELWEVKPKKETKPPRQGKKKSPKTKMYEDLTYAINQAKWHAAKHFCDQNNLKFRLVTEDHMFF